MKSRPIIFSSEDVRAIIDGSLTQTRRVIKPQWNYHQVIGLHCPYGVIGDQLWVRESFRELGSVQLLYDKLPGRGSPDTCVYKADADYDGPFRSPIYMPRWASRITLTVVNTRIERLQDISGSDAAAEGLLHCGVFGYDDCYSFFSRGTRGLFQHRWDQLYGKKYPWKDNPFVWVIEFQQVKR